MSDALKDRLPEYGMEAIEQLNNDDLSELAANVLSERRSRGGRGPESRLDSMIELAGLDHRRLNKEIEARARHLGEHVAALAVSGEASGGVRAYGSEGADLDELVTKRSEAWERYRALVYVRDGDFPEEYPEESS